MGNSAAGLSNIGSRLVDKMRSRVPPNFGGGELVAQPPMENASRAGLISRLIGGGPPQFMGKAGFGRVMSNFSPTIAQNAAPVGAVPRKKRNMKKAQRVNPVEVPTRKLY